MLGDHEAMSLAHLLHLSTALLLHGLSAGGQLPYEGVTLLEKVVPMVEEARLCLHVREELMVEGWGGGSYRGGDGEEGVIMVEVMSDHGGGMGRRE